MKAQCSPFRASSTPPSQVSHEWLGESGAEPVETEVPGSTTAMESGEVVAM